MAETITKERAEAYKKYLETNDYLESSVDTNYSFVYVQSVATRKRYNIDIVNDLNSRLRKAILKAEKQIKKDKKL